MYKITHSKPSIIKEEGISVLEGVMSRMQASGDKTLEFEKKMCKFNDVKYGKATNSGTAALHLSLLSLDINEGDEIIIPSYVCISLLNAINYVRAKAIFVDVNSDFINKGCNISVNTIRPKITEKTKAIIVPHMFGIPAEIDKILKLGIPIIEDCALSFGAKYKNKRVGGFSDMSIFSFYANKVISTGYGGMILTSKEEIKNKIEKLTKCDEIDEYNISYNYNLSDINASLGVKQLERLEELIVRRKKIGKWYNNAFYKKVKIIKSKEGFPFRYLIFLKNKKNRNCVLYNLLKKGIDSKPPIYKPLHKYFDIDVNKFKYTEEIHNCSLSIPCYPSLRNNEINYIIKSILNSL